MNWEPRPIPDVTPETERCWEAAANERLLLSACEDCGLVYYYPRALCSDCFSDNTGWLEAEGTGEVYSYSPTRTMSGRLKEDLPLVVAYVELDEGPRMLTNIDTDPADVEIGTRVAVKFVQTEKEDVAIPIFEPV